MSSAMLAAVDLGSEGTEPLVTMGAVSVDELGGLGTCFLILLDANLVPELASMLGASLGDRSPEGRLDIR